MRELGNRRTIRELGSLVRAQDPTALFLAETWTDEGRLKRLCGELLFDCFWIVLKVNKIGYLALFWKKIDAHRCDLFLIVIQKSSGVLQVFMALQKQQGNPKHGL